MTKNFSRRDVLQNLGLALAAIPLGRFVAACGDTATTGEPTVDGGATATDTGAALVDSGATATDAGAATGWATGGTASMTGNYPDPFATAVTSCPVGTAVTQGPCTEAADQVRKDISEGYGGLPMRIALKVVDTSCNPIEGATVKIWHTQKTGSYSGDTPNPNMCLKDQADSAKHYFRGLQTTDASGRVDFDSCFPGWYRGRTVHIHYTVSKGGKSFTSQLVFDSALVAELFASHPDYASYGQPDTTNANDNVVGGKDLTGFVLQTSRQADGALLAAKVLPVAF